MNTAPNLAERIRLERERLGLSQAQMGELGGVNRITQGAYERGERSCTTSYLQAIEAAGADVIFIVSGIRYDRDTRAPAALTMVTMQVAMPPRQALQEMFAAILMVYPDLHGDELARALALHLPSGLAQLVDLLPVEADPTEQARVADSAGIAKHPEPRAAKRR